jgi:hypothetical protein
VYTQKDKMKVVVCTSLYRVEGEMYLLPGSRLTDIVNVKTGKDFIPITNAKVMDLNGKAIYTVDFVSINRDSIIMIFPSEEDVSKESSREF